MPEGHTVHRLARDHAKWFAGQAMVVLSPQGRFERESKLLSGRCLESTDAYGKHLIYTFSGSKRMHVHLGLYGKFRKHKNPPPAPQGAVRVRMIGAEHSLDLNGPNTCELITPGEFSKLQDRLGADPLRADADPERAWAKISRSRSSIGALLMNQSVIAGIGNIYRAEILHILAIHPDRPGQEIKQHEFDLIWDLAVRLLNIGVKYNRIITVERPEDARPLSRLNSGERLHVYKKEICPRCGAELYCWDIAGRTVYACDACQV